MRLHPGTNVTSVTRIFRVRSYAMDYQGNSYEPYQVSLAPQSASLS